MKFPIREKFLSGEGSRQQVFIYGRPWSHGLIHVLARVRVSQLRLNSMKFFSLLYLGNFSLSNYFSLLLFSPIFILILRNCYSCIRYSCQLRLTQNDEVAQNRQFWVRASFTLDLETTVYRLPFLHQKCRKSCKKRIHAKNGPMVQNKGSRRDSSYNQGWAMGLTDFR